MSSRLSFTLHEVVNELDRYADQLLRRKFQVTFGQFHFLAVLAEVGPVDMSTLAACMGVTRAAVSKRTPSMVADGWVTTRSQPGEGRRVTLTLTAKGIELVEQAGTRLEGEMLSTLGELAESGIRIDHDALNAQLVALVAALRKKGD